MRDDFVSGEVMRARTVGEWRRVMGMIERGKLEEARRALDSVEGGIDEWVSKGRELTSEIEGMKVDLMKLREKVLTYILQANSGELPRIPERVLRKNDPPRKGTRSYAGSRVASTSSDSSHSAQPLGENKYIHEIQRKGSEKLVDDAMIGASPVTVFTPPQGYLKPSQFPSTPYPGSRESRDVTPTPADPKGLRYQLSTTRKKAALYSRPRWPTSGRPSPSPSPPADTPPSPTPKPRIHRSCRGRRGFGDETDSIINSIYDEIDEPREHVESGVKSDDEGEGDPARRIWKGIDEEYSSPEGGRFHRQRRMRRQVSIRGCGEGDNPERVVL